jgi:hypothetical protein
MTRRGLFNDDPLGAMLGGLFGMGRFAEPPDTVPLRILSVRGAAGPSVTREQVKSAFRAAVMRAHPDLQLYQDTALSKAAEAAIADEPDVQELVWARDVMLRKIPEPRPVTGDGLPRADFGSRYEPDRCKVCDSKRLTPHGDTYNMLYSWGGREVRWAGYCSRCASDAENERQRELRRQARANRPCATCGELFTPPRSDGRYCTPACRQRAYRARTKATA